MKDGAEPPQRTRKRKGDSGHNSHARSNTKSRLTGVPSHTYIDASTSNLASTADSAMSDSLDAGDHLSSSGSLSPMLTTSFVDYFDQRPWLDRAKREDQHDQPKIAHAASSSHRGGGEQDPVGNEQRAPVVPMMGTTTSAQTGQVNAAVVSQYQRVATGQGQKGVQVRRRLK
ncbi:hypothetical protein LTR56_026026 [Elasticomyces elasticus]|nr:hypothetical protein LTR56_026026 [Elasticomyces elasticus]KAK4906258.1 hypothetical protein LTR49_024570 [Elasticomyces elasticus]KAK5739724.1 hypothetical protein LTS12_025175 [Elasticomyces elasticus]